MSFLPSEVHAAVRAGAQPADGTVHLRTPLQFIKAQQGEVYRKLSDQDFLRQLRGHHTLPTSEAGNQVYQFAKNLSHIGHYLIRAQHYFKGPFRMPQSVCDTLRIGEEYNLDYLLALCNEVSEDTPDVADFAAQGLDRAYAFVDQLRNIKHSFVNYPHGLSSRVTSTVNNLVDAANHWVDDNSYTALIPSLPDFPNPISSCLSSLETPLPIRPHVLTSFDAINSYTSGRAASVYGAFLKTIPVLTPFDINNYRFNTAWKTLEESELHRDAHPILRTVESFVGFILRKRLQALQLMDALLYRFHTEHCADSESLGDWLCVSQAVSTWLAWSDFAVESTPESYKAIAEETHFARTRIIYKIKACQEKKLLSGIADPGRIAEPRILAWQPNLRHASRENTTLVSRACWENLTRPANNLPSVLLNFRNSSASYLQGAINSRIQVASRLALPIYNARNLLAAIQSSAVEGAKALASKIALPEDSDKWGNLKASQVNILNCLPDGNYIKTRPEDNSTAYLTVSTLSDTPETPPPAFLQGKRCWMLCPSRYPHLALPFIYTVDLFDMHNLIIFAHPKTARYLLSFYKVDSFNPLKGCPPSHEHLLHLDMPSNQAYFAFKLGKTLRLGNRRFERNSHPFSVGSAIPPSGDKPPRFYYESLYEALNLPVESDATNTQHPANMVLRFPLGDAITSMNDSVGQKNFFEQYETALNQAR